MVVRMRRNRSQTAQRRSHHAISSVHATLCECGELRIPHRACPSCGKYNGRVVIDVVAEQKRAARRAKRKRDAIGTIADTENKPATEKKGE